MYILAKRDLGKAPTVCPAGLADLPSINRDSDYTCVFYCYENLPAIAAPVALHSLCREKLHGEGQGRRQNLPVALFDPAQDSKVGA